jgi:formylglycine-generating enzyme
MKRVFAVAALALLSLVGVAQASITIDTVAVGDPGNAADTASHSGNPAGQGSVSYAYNIGKYEVTAGQYTAFLNAVAKTDTYGLYSTYMWEDSYYSDGGCRIQRTGGDGDYSYSVASDYANRPVNLVSYWDACRFTNWLHNGQKTGAQDLTTTEDGAYYLNGYTGYAGIYGRTIQRKAGWQWAVTSEDEWYKAAYYKGGGTNAGYWSYPTQSDSAPGRDMNDASGNNANYYTDDYLIGSPYYRTEVGEFQNSDSTYGTFDQGGNVWELNETALFWDEEPDLLYRGLRGGSFHPDDLWLVGGGSPRSSARHNIHSSAIKYWYTGFRVVQAVPEPSSIIALLGGLAGLLGMRWRRA